MEQMISYLENNFTHILTVAIAAIFVLTILYVVLKEKRNQELLRREGIVVPAIVDCYQTNDGTCEMFYYFTTSEGINVHGRANIKARSFMETHYPPGSEISVIYAPSKPKQTCRLSDGFMQKLDLLYKKEGNKYPAGF